VGMVYKLKLIFAMNYI